MNNIETAHPTRRIAQRPYIFFYSLCGLLARVKRRVGGNPFRTGAARTTLARRLANGGTVCR